MRILRNETYRVENCGILDDGEYRIIYVDPPIKIFLFKLGAASLSTKPILLKHDDFVGLVENKLALLIEYGLPMEVGLSNLQLSEAERERRDNQYALIQEIVDDVDFLMEYCKSRRSNAVINHAKLKEVRPLKIYRLLKAYWTFGQTKNALLKFSSKFGGKGKHKSASSKTRGRPIDCGVFGLIKRKPINIGQLEKAQIKNAVVKCAKTSKNFKYSVAHQTYKTDYCEEEYELANLKGRPAQAPTYQQFKYWAKILVPKENLAALILSNSDFESNKRGLSSSVSDKNKVPGFRYEIDATTADVYIVSEFDRELILGRPVIYFLVDVASRLIAGMHISTKYASWNLAREVIFNGIFSKVAYCKRYGINIEDKDWPALGMPTFILCDRGEMLGEKPEALSDDLNVTLQFTPTARGDAKSIVERRFGIANEDIHYLPGTTLGQLRKRGEPDYRLDAALTIHAFTKIMVEKVIEHNKYRQFDDLVSPELISRDLTPTPINYWNTYVQLHQHGLSQVSEDEFRAKLMRPGFASVTERGIKFDDRIYQCEKSIREKWSTTARNNGWWRIEARSDSSWSNYIYIRDVETGKFLKCELSPKDRIFENKHLADIIYLNEWKASKKESTDLPLSVIKRSKRKNTLVKEEVEKTKAAQKNLSKTARISGIKENRKTYNENLSKKLESESMQSSDSHQTKLQVQKRKSILSTIKKISEEND